MATAVLRSEDCLKGRLHLDAFASRPPPPSKSCRKKSPKSSRNAPAAVPSRSPSPKATPPRSNRRSPPPPPGKAAGAPKRGLVMEKVKILKRGQDLDAVTVSADLVADSGDLGVFTTDRLGPEPEILPKKLGFVDLASVYAGPAFFASPSPSALPMPGFFLKKSGDLVAGNDEVATRTLRCVLRLD